jgi:hypothetical protein
VLLAWTPVHVQGQFFLYHGVALPVVAAVIVTRALCRNIWLTLPLIVLSAWSGWLLSSSIVSSRQLVTWWLLSAALSSLVLLLLAIYLHGRGIGAGYGLLPPLMAAVIVTVSFLPAALPTSAWSISLRGSARNTVLTNWKMRDFEQVRAEQVRKIVGAGTYVTYAAFGSVPYYIGNPTSCPHPSLVFLQRSRYQRQQEYTRSWWENVDCFRNNPGEWLIWDVEYMTLRRMPPEGRSAIKAAFDCKQARNVGRLSAP